MSAENRMCPYCAEEIKAEAVLCRHCKMAVDPMSRSSQETAPPPVTDPQRTGGATLVSKGQGLSIASLILGVISITIGFIDIGLVVGGDYAYIDPSEIGLLAVLSLTALGLAIGARSKRQNLYVPALVVSIIAVVVMFAAAGYSL